MYGGLVGPAAVEGLDRQFFKTFSTGAGRITRFVLLIFFIDLGFLDERKIYVETF